MIKIIKKLAILFTFIVLAIILIGIWREKSLNSNKKLSDYVKGEIIVSLNKGAKIKEAQDLILSYGLKYKVDETVVSEDVVGERPFFYVVYVPEGGEQQWVERFEKNEIVKGASLNYIVRIQ